MAKDLTNSSVDRQNILNNQYALAEIQKVVHVSGIMFEGRMIFFKEQVADFFEETNPGDLLKVFKDSIRSIIETELSHTLGADYYERSEDRNNYRNGYRERQKPLSTPMGPVTI
ncbi:MAG: transposase, partial [Candidatus Cloacimonadaceae bacterium]